MPVPLHATKDPAEALSFTLDFTAELGTDTIAGAPVWSVSPTGLTIVNQTNTALKATVMVSGGTKGIRYRLKCVATGASAQVYVRTLFIRCEAK